MCGGIFVSGRRGKKQSKMIYRGTFRFTHFLPNSSNVLSAYWHELYEAGWSKLNARTKPLMKPWSSSHLSTSTSYLALKESGSRTSTVTGYFTQLLTIAYSYCLLPKGSVPSGPSLYTQTGKHYRYTGTV